jgi:ankyrin repeat protein
MRMTDLGRATLAAGFVAWALIVCVGAAGSASEIADAAKRGDREAVRALLKRRAEVNAADLDGTTALHWAVRSDDSEMADLLIRAGANANAATTIGVTPLALAAENGSARLVTALLAAGANPNAVDTHGVTALMIASRTGRVDAVKALIAKGSRVNEKEPRMGETALVWAATRNHAEAAQALIAAGAAVNVRSNVLNMTPYRWETDGMLSSMLPVGGWTPLMYAARDGAVDAARVLVAGGANLDLQDPVGTTALVLAIENAHFDLAAALLEKGADPNVVDNAGMAALFAAVDMHTLGPIDYRPPPPMNDRTTSVDLIRLLIDHGALVDARLKRPVLGRHIDRGDRLMGAGSTPLMRAAKTNDISVMKLLVEKGANPLLRQDDQTTVLMIAAHGGARPGTYAGPYPVTEDGAIEAVKLALEWGVDVNGFNARGQTALHSAVSRRATQLIRLLVEHGARLDLRTEEGKSVLELAKPTGGSANVPLSDQARKAAADTEALLRELMAQRGMRVPPAPTTATARVP